MIDGLIEQRGRGLNPGTGSQKVDRRSVIVHADAWDAGGRADGRGILPADDQVLTRTDVLPPSRPSVVVRHGSRSERRSASRSRSSGSSSSISPVG